MKRGLYFLVAMFMMVSSVEATNALKLTNRIGVNYYAYDNAVNFFERGIEFFVFTNGEFDFDTRFRNRGVRIDRDFRGRIRRIGNVFINYDFRGNVSRIGSVFMRYNRGLLTRVGNLRVSYDRWDYPVFYGNVRNFYYHNGVRFNVNFGDVCNYNDPYFFRNDFRRNYTRFREDRNFYYYKARPNANIGKRSTIIKRRKAVTANSDRKIRRRSNNSYRKSKTNVTTKRNKSTNSRRSEVKRNSSKKINEKASIKRSTRNLSKKDESPKRRSTRTRRN